MPELPEVETTRLSLLKQVRDQVIESVTLHRGDLRFPFPKDLEKRLTSRKITNIRRRAKYLLMDLDSGDVLLAHLGMSGSFRVVLAADYMAKAHDHVLLHLGDERIIVYHDPRRFGMMDILSKTQEKTHILLKDMGPEPLSDDFSVDYLQKVLLKRGGPIKPTLMDQKIVVGVGNIYASESLFLARIHPTTKSSLILDRAEVLIEAIQKTLRDAITSGGSTLRDFTSADGATGYFQHHFNVYERKGLPCVACDAPIEQIVQAGRASYFCPHCQKEISPRSRATKKIRQKTQ